MYSQIDIAESQRIKFNETIISERLLFCLHSLRKLTSHIQTYKRSRLKRFKATTLSHVRETIKETLKKWRDEKKSSVFRNNFLVQDDNYEFFLNNDMIKNMIKNVHLIKTMNDFRIKMTNWVKDWLNKYDKKLLKLVVVVVIIAKKKLVARKLTISRNIETIQENFIF